MGYDVKEGINDGNVMILRTTLSEYIAEEYKDGSPVLLKDMKPGDIIIFFNQGHDSHTAIYLGGGKIAHAASEEMGVTVTDMEYDEETGNAGYNGKQIKCIIRRAVDEKEKEPEPDDSNNIISTELEIESKESSDIEISVEINGKDISIYKPDKIGKDVYIDVTKRVNLGNDKGATLNVIRDNNKVYITTISDKDTAITVTPKISVVKKTISLIPKDEDN